MSYVVDKAESFLSDVKDIVKGIWDSTRDYLEFLFTLDFDALESSIRTLFRDVIAPILKPVFDLIGIEDETLYSIEVITTPLIDKEAKYLQTHVIDSILQDTDLIDDLIMSIHTAQKITIRSFLNYGKGHYTKGVPTVTVSEYFTDTEVVTDVLETIEGADITIGSAAFSDPNWDLWCKDYLVDNNSYVIATNILDKGGVDWYYDYAALNGGETAFIVYLYRDIDTNVVVDDYTQIIYDPTEFTDTWTRTTTTIVHTPADAGDPDINVVDTNYVRTPTSTGDPPGTTFVNISDTDTPSTESTTLGTEVTKYNSGGYYGVVYALDSAPSLAKIWFYETALGTYPELDNSLIGGDTDNINTLPIVELRRDFINIDNDVTSEDYLTTKRILDILNIVTLDDLLTSITDNPDIALIQDAYLLFGVNLYTTDQHSLKYLYGFFYMLAALPKYSKTEFDALTAADKSEANFIYLISEGAYNVTISGNYIEITEFSGYIGKVGYAETEFTISANTTAVVADLDDRVDPTLQDPADSLGLINSVFKVRVQLTEDTYSEIEVSGLNLITYVVTTGVDVGVKLVELVDPTTGSDSDKANFLIPMNYYLLRSLPPGDCEQIIYDGCNLVIYAEDSTDLAYYETPSFLSFISIVIDIIAIVLLVLSLGAAANVSQALWILARQLLIQAGLTALLKEVLSHNLSDTEKAAAAVLFVIAGQKANGIIKPESLNLLADSILLAVDSITTFFEVDLENKTADLLEEQAELESLITTKNEEIEAAEEWLTPEGTIDTFNLLNSRVLPILDTEITPSGFYAQSLLVNVAPIIYAQTSTYVSSVLDLDNITTTFNRNTSTNFELLPELT